MHKISIVLNDEIMNAIASGNANISEVFQIFDAVTIAVKEKLRRQADVPEDDDIHCSCDECTRAGPSSHSVALPP